MYQQSTETLGEAVFNFLRVNLEVKFAFRRGYDNWTLKQMLADRRRRLMIRTQKLDVNNHVKYGSDLAVSKFIFQVCPRSTIRDGNGKWIALYKDLPSEFDKNFKITAIKAANGNLITEGIDNFVGLDHLESLDLSSNKRLDDFACDQLSRQFRKSKTLRQINISYNPLISIYGLEILFRIPSLKKIIALETMASDYENIDLFTLSAEDERQCQVFTLNGGRQYKSDELEAMRWDKMKVRESASQ